MSEIVLLVYNNHDLTRRCLDSLNLHARSGQKLIIVDDCSAIETRDFLRTVSSLYDRLAVELVRNERNCGFIGSANVGLQKTTSPYICLLNNDTLVTADWLERMEAVLDAHPDIGIVSPASTTYGLKPGQGESLESFASARRETYAGRFQETHYCVGFCLLLRKKMLEQIGYFDPVYGVGYFEDNDLGQRAARAGYRSVIALDSYVWHREHGTFTSAERQRQFARNRDIFHDRWNKPKRLLVHAPDSGLQDDVERLRVVEGCLRLARQGNWVRVVTDTKRRDVLEALDVHAAIVVKRIPRILHAPYLAGYVWKKRKKKVDAIHVLRMARPGFRHALQVVCRRPVKELEYV